MIPTVNPSKDITSGIRAFVRKSSPSLFGTISDQCSVAPSLAHSSPLLTLLALRFLEFFLWTSAVSD